MTMKTEPQGAISRRRIARLIAGVGVLVGVLAVSGTVMAASPAPGNTGLPGVSTGAPATTIPAGGAPSTQQLTPQQATPATGGGASGSQPGASLPGQARKPIPQIKTIPAVIKTPVTQP